MSEGYKEELLTAGDVVIKVVELTSSTGTVIDVKNFVSEINIYEDIFSNTLNGAIVLTDSVELLSGLPLVGDELLTIWVKTPTFTDEYGETIKKTFAVYSIKNRTLTGDRGQVYTLYFCSLEGMQDNVTQVSKKFEGTTDEIADKIYSEYIKQKRCYGSLDSEDQTPMIIADTPHESKTAFLSNMWSPFRCLNYVAKRSIGNKQKSPSFLFYETTKGFYFTSIDSLIKSQLDAGAVFADYRYLQKPVDASTEGVSEASGSGPQLSGRNLAHEFNVVQEIKFKEQIDLLKSQDQGRFASSTTVLDLTMKLYENTAWDYGYSYPDYVHMENYIIENGSSKFRENEGDNMTYPVNVTRSALSKTFFRTVHQGSISKEELIDYDPAKFLGPRQSVLGDISGLTMEITVPGRTDAEVGKLINFKYPRVSDAAEKTDETLWDPFLSGVWMITAIHHKITPVAHKMIMEIAKDSFHTPFEFTTRAPNPNLPEENGSGDSADPNESSSPASVNKAGWTHPTGGKGRVSSKPGPRKSPGGVGSTQHQGYDIALPEGSPIYAAKDGTVTRSEVSSSYGNVIYIDHGGGYESRYAHGQAGSRSVTVGQKVKAGQQIMRCDSTGHSTGHHLHFEIRLNGKYQDPGPYIS